MSEWSVEFLDDTIRRELDALSPELKARFRRITELIMAFGLPNVGAPHIKKLTGPLWEMRMRGRDGIARALYVTRVDKRVVIVRVFVKKTQKTPKRELALALERIKQLRW